MDHKDELKERIELVAGDEPITLKPSDSVPLPVPVAINEVRSSPVQSGISVQALSPGITVGRPGPFAIAVLTIFLIVVVPVLLDDSNRSFWSVFAAGIGLPSIYFLPYLISTARNVAGSTKIGLLNLFLGFTGVGWVYALVMALKGSPVSGKGKDFDRLFNHGILLSAVSVLGAVLCFAIPQTEMQLLTVCGGVVGALQGLITLHWGLTQFNLQRNLNNSIGAKHRMGGWTALLASIMSTGIWFMGIALATAALVVKSVFEWSQGLSGAHLLGPLQLSFVAGGAALFVAFVIAAWTSVCAWFNYKLAAGIEGPSSPERWRLIRRLLPGLGAVTINFVTAYSIGDARSVVLIMTFQGLSLAYGYHMTRRLLRQRQERESPKALASSASKGSSDSEI